MTKRSWNPFSVVQWIAWLGATLTAGVMAMIFIYSTFQTKSDAAQSRENQQSGIVDIKANVGELKEDIGHRMDRLENKVDRLLYFQTRSSKGDLSEH